MLFIVLGLFASSTLATTFMIIKAHTEYKHFDGQINVKPFKPLPGIDTDVLTKRLRRVRLCDNLFRLFSFTAIMHAMYLILWITAP